MEVYSITNIIIYLSIIHLSIYVVYIEMSIIGGSQELVINFHIRKLKTTITFDRKGLFSIGKKLLVGNYLLFHLCHSGGRSSEGVRGLARPQIRYKTARVVGLTPSLKSQGRG